VQNLQIKQLKILTKIFWMIVQIGSFAEFQIFGVDNFLNHRMKRKMSSRQVFTEKLTLWKKTVNQLKKCSAKPASRSKRN